MRLNINKYQEMMQQRNIEKADIERMTGITVQTLDWIFENEYLEVSTLERLAQVVECGAREIALQDHYGNENVIEWVKDGKTAILSLTQGRTISRVMKLAKSRPEECKIVAENKDGSICARVPISWIRINPPKQFTDEQKKKWRTGLTEIISTVLIQGMKWTDFQFLFCPWRNVRVQG